MRRDATGKRSVLGTLSGIGVALLFIVVAVPAVGLVGRVVAGDLVHVTGPAEGPSSVAADGDDGATNELTATARTTTAWSCYYLPTMNDNWHDDVECARGLKRIRPELLKGKSFVTESDMTAAAARYEKRLNK